MTAMTSRERVVKTLRHQAPDIVPLDLGGTESSGITGIAYNRLRQALDLPPGETQIFDVYQQIAKVEDDLRRVIQCDTVPLIIEPRRWKPFNLSDGSPCQIPEKWCPQREANGDLVVKDPDGSVIARMPEGGFYFEPTCFPLAHVTTPADLNAFQADIEAYDWPGFADESLESIALRARRLFEDTEWAVVANLQLHLLAAGQFLRGYEVFMMDLLDNPALAHALLERLCEAYIRRCNRYFDQVGNAVQVVLVNDDLGTQQGPMLSPDTYRKMIWPYQKRLFQFIKRKSGAFILFHSCGAVSAFIPALIEAGVDALNPVQVSAAGMDSQRLKAEFGRDLVFWGGGCDTQAILSRGTPAQVREEVCRRMADFAPGGGFVFTQVHNIQPDVPSANILAMLEAFQECR
ncbi:MAG: methyltransferase [Verrucomicrobia bacterium]|nr:methyltransferase [Verrucomicrobiota bacterium]MBU1734560.1 methyltransferase [Verrucomicrobiota bacterium]MBU1856629.1 methyltransferase [Verrucomicrobiota bacterium]